MKLLSSHIDACAEFLITRYSEADECIGVDLPGWYQRIKILAVDCLIAF